VLLATKTSIARRKCRFTVSREMDKRSAISRRVRPSARSCDGYAHLWPASSDKLQQDKGYLAAASGLSSRQRRQACVADIVGRYVAVCDGSHPTLDSTVYAGFQ
jgi:hypothetical protein